MSLASVTKSLEELFKLSTMASFTVTGIYLSDAELADIKTLLGPAAAGTKAVATFKGVGVFSKADFQRGDNSGVHLGIPYTLRS